MSEVQNALGQQRQVWKDISQRIIRNKSWQDLPPTIPRRIVLIGEGSSYFAAKLTAYALNREYYQKKHRPYFKVFAYPSTAVGVDFVPTHGDWVFGLSHRGRTELTLKALEATARAGGFPILVSAQGVSEKSVARLVLPTSPLEKCEPHTMGMTGAICAVTHLLLGEVAAEYWKTLGRPAHPNLAVLREKIEKNVPTVLLGEWEGEWIAREISLKLTEVARVRTPVYRSEEYFHGPQSLAGPSSFGEKIWHVAMPGDPRNSKIQAHYQSRISLKHPLAWVSSLVDLQWLTLALALNLEVNPDGIVP